MYFVYDNRQIFCNISNLIIIYKSNIEYIIDENNGKLNLNDIDCYPKYQKATIIKKLEKYDSLVFKNNDNIKKFTRYFLISNIIVN